MAPSLARDWTQSRLAARVHHRPLRDHVFFSFVVLLEFFYSTFISILLPQDCLVTFLEIGWSRSSSYRFLLSVYLPTLY